MRHVFIVNPKAGKGNYVENHMQKIKKRVEELELDYKIHVTTAPYEGIDFVKREAASGEHIRFYSCGGDGTLYEVVNGMAEFPNTEVAALPLGSGNDFIRLFGKKEDFQDVDVHINGTPVQLDLMRCGNRYAINQCSMGFDAEVCAKQAYFKKLLFFNGESAYMGALLYCFLKKMDSVFTISIDGGEPFTVPVMFCFAGNSRWYGGGFMAAPKAIPDDGLLDLVIVKKDVSRLKLLTMINEYKNGKHLDWDITTFLRCKKINIKSENPAAVNIDGETEYVNESTFELIEKGIKYVVPSNSDYFERKKNGTL